MASITHCRRNLCRDRGARVAQAAMGDKKRRARLRSLVSRRRQFACQLDAELAVVMLPELSRTNAAKLASQANPVAVAHVESHTVIDD